MEWILFLAVGAVIGLVVGLVVARSRWGRMRRQRTIAVEAELQASRQRADRASGEAQALRTRLTSAEVLAGRAGALEADLVSARREVNRARARAARLDDELAAARPPARGRDRGDVTPLPQAAVPVAKAVAAMAPAFASDAGVERAAAVGAPLDAASTLIGDERPPARSSARRGRAPLDTNAATQTTMPVPSPPSGPRDGTLSVSLEMLPAEGDASDEADLTPESGSPVEAALPGQPTGSAATPPPPGWSPIRPGLSDPRAWLGTISPSGVPYAEDDLQCIHGVGPYLARRLHEEGILTWRQIAEWNEDDMSLASRRIGSFADRIRREDWVGSARVLHEEAYGERLP